MIYENLGRIPSTMRRSERETIMGTVIILWSDNAPETLTSTAHLSELQTYMLYAKHYTYTLPPETI
jgi:hypothetical protein